MTERQEFSLWLAAVALCLTLLLTACQPSLPRDLRALAVERAEAVALRFGHPDLTLDNVEGIAIRDVTSPPAQPLPPTFESVESIWCFTTRARGTLGGGSREASAQWIAVEKPDGEWALILRHFTTYPSLWDDLCDGANPASE
jgi:hypothetical protein